ncbi:MAG: hypothetical protein COA79_10085 [Planctomycetota bacterium]|nr:MAG: hypothetical protein COA79_10085 [Planctomycetota bacterium]
MSEVNQIELPPNYKVEQECFSGPMDLLLHLIKKDEVDIFELDISVLTNQYVEYIKSIDLNNIENAGDFLIMAATLLEIKSRALLPHDDEEGDDADDGELRANFIQQLLEYKKFKRLSQELVGQQNEFLESYASQGNYKPSPEDEKTKGTLKVSLNALVLSFAKIIKETALDLATSLRTVVVPLEDYMEKLKNLVSEKAASFFKLREESNDPSDWVSVFLSILELGKIRATVSSQAIPFGDILIMTPEEAEKLTASTEETTSPNPTQVDDNLDSLSDQN